MTAITPERVVELVERSSLVPRLRAVEVQLGKALYALDLFEARINHDVLPPLSEEALLEDLLPALDLALFFTDKMRKSRN